MASRILQSSDVGAPQMLGGSAGTLIGVLKAVLVNGYGSTASLGWTLEFEDAIANVAVFRMGGGTRFFMRVQDDNAFPGYALITCYEQMISANQGYFPCPLSTATDTRYMCKGTGVVTPTEWKVIGDNKGFWWLCRHLFNTYQASTTDTVDFAKFFEPHYVGDYLPFHLNNKYNFCTVLRNKSVLQPSVAQCWTSETSHSLTTPISNVCIMRHFGTNAVGSLPVGVSGNTPGSNDTLFGNNNRLSPLYGRNVYTKPVIMCYDYDAVYGTYPIIGQLPGMLNPIRRGVAPLNVTELVCRREACNENDLLVFSFVGAFGSPAATPASNHQQLAIIIGDNFRYAY